MKTGQAVTVNVGGESRRGKIVEIVTRNSKPEYRLKGGTLVREILTSTKCRVNVEGRGDSFFYFDYEVNDG